MANISLQTVTFNKQFHWTTLEVKFRGTLGAAYGFDAGPQATWRVLFNEAHCSNPGYIESVHYNSDNVTEHHKASGREWKTFH